MTALSSPACPHIRAIRSSAAGSCPVSAAACLRISRASRPPEGGQRPHLGGVRLGTEGEAQAGFALAERHRALRRRLPLPGPPGDADTGWVGHPHGRGLPGVPQPEVKLCPESASAARELSMSSPTASARAWRRPRRPRPAMSRDCPDPGHQRPQPVALAQAGSPAQYAPPPVLQALAGGMGLDRLLPAAAIRSLRSTGPGPAGLAPSALSFLPLTTSGTAPLSPNMFSRNGLSHLKITSYKDEIPYEG